MQSTPHRVTSRRHRATPTDSAHGTMAAVTRVAASITASLSRRRRVRVPEALATLQPRAALDASPATLRGSSDIRYSSSPSSRGVRTRAAAPDVSAIAQIALRDDYDPVVFLFCLNALFLSVVINVVNYGMDKDEETGMLKMPEGGVGAILAKTKRGMADYFMAVPKQFKEMYAGKDEALERAIEELEDAKMAAYAARGTANAESTAKAFMDARRRAVDAGLSPGSELLNPGLPSNTE